MPYDIGRGGDRGDGVEKGLCHPDRQHRILLSQRLTAGCRITIAVTHHATHLKLDEADHQCHYGQPHLQEQMLEFSRSALVDADVLLYVTDVQDNPDKNADFLEKVKRIKAKVFLIINKIDLTTQETLEQLVEYWHRVLPEATVFPISAQQKFGTDQLFAAIREALPECPPFFPKDQLTDKSSRFFVDEMIREKILLNYDKEIPYSVEVEVESFLDEEPDEQHPEGMIRIGAVIYVERDSQKGIIIGKGGKALKRVGTQARREIEAFFGKPVFLQLFVKVDKDWRSSQTRLRHYGYDLN